MNQQKSYIIKKKNYMYRRIFIIKNLGFLLEKITFKQMDRVESKKRRKTHLQLNTFIDLVLNFFCAVDMFFFS